MTPSIATPWMWALFLAFVLGMLALDLGVFHRKTQRVSMRDAALWSAVWVGLALGFNAWIWQAHGAQAGLEFLTGYLIEKSLSIDNIFIFVLIFGAFSVPEQYQHRVLFWGVLGALLMRAVFILLGGVLLARFEWILYLFGAFLLMTGIKMLRHRGTPSNPADNPLFRWFRRVAPSTPEYRGKAFLVREGGRTLATPLLVVLIAVELTDLIFAVDSVPAIFAITKDPFLVFTSNIFAILGLRSLYFLLAGMVDRFHFLKVGLAFVLMFVGAKLALHGVVKVPILLSLGVITALIGGSILISWLWPRRHAPLPAEERP
jgi:tellurite resistance protein TerC